MARIQSLAPFHKLTTLAPPLAPKPTPAVAPTVIQPAIAQDGTYLDTLGLKLNEAATRALMSSPGGSGNDVWRGKKPLQAGKGRQFASLIETELDASQGNTNLRHAILRLLPRSLHVIVSNLSNQVSQLTSVAEYAPSTVALPLHASTLHALALATFAGEILETFRAYKLGAASSDLATVQGHLETIITRVTAPLFAQLLHEMSGLLEPIGQPAVPTGGAVVPGFPAKPGKPHPAVLNVGQYMPQFARVLRRCVIPSSQYTQDALAKFLIGTVWQALVQLSHRPPTKYTPLPSVSNALFNGSTFPASAASTIASTVVQKASTISVAFSQISLTPPASPPNAAGSGKKPLKLTPPSSPPVGKRGLTDSPKVGGMLRLKRVPSAGSNGSRSTSPDTRNNASQPSQQQQLYQAQASAAWLNDLASDAKALGEILVHSDAVPRPVDGSLAREAVDEGFDRFVAFREWISAAAASAANGAVAGLNGVNSSTVTTSAATTTLQMLMDSAPEDVPLLILLPVLLSQAWLLRSPSSSSAAGTPTAEKNVDLTPTQTTTTTTYPGVAKLIGYESEDTYRRGVLVGFRRAEECEGAIAKCLLSRLGGAASASASAWAEGVMVWLAQRVA